MNEKIFRPSFIETPSIRSSLEDIDRYSWLVDRVLLVPKHEAWFRREVAVRRATATTRIEGATLGEEEVSELVKKGASAKPSGDELANLNAVAAYEFVDYLSDQPDIAIDELVIRELNRYFLSGMDEMLTPGVYRKGQNRVGNYTPPDQGDVPDLMREFAHWLRREDNLNPVLKAGTAHIQLIAIHPFWDGNGRVARALATLVLQRSHFHFRKLLSLESFMFAVRDNFYLPAIAATLGTQYDSGYDVTPWLEFFTTALEVESKGLMDKLTDWHRMMSDIQETLGKLDINRRQAEALAYIHRTGKISRAEYIEITGASPGTASRDLAQLVQRRLLVAQGATKGRVYLRNADLLKPRAKELAEQRPLFDAEENPRANRS